MPGTDNVKDVPIRPHGHLRKASAGAPVDLVAIDILSGLPATLDGYKNQVPSCSYRLFFQMARGSTLVRCRGTHVHARTLQHLFQPFWPASPITQ